MVECIKCKAWSHLHCVNLTQRTAKKVDFQCHRCKLLQSKKPSTSLSGRRVGQVGQGPGKGSKGKQQPTCKSSQRPPVEPSQVLPSHSIINTSSTNNGLTTECSAYTHPCVVAKDPPNGVNSSATSADCTSVPSSDNLTSEQSMRRGKCACLCTASESCNLCVNSNARQDTCSVSRADINSLLSKLESSIRSELNVRLLSLEDQVAKLSQTVRTLRANGSLVKDHNPTSGPPSDPFHHSRSSSHHPRRIPSHQSRKDSRLSSNSLPFHVIWGTSRSCSAQVILKAISALLTRSAQSSKRSFRQRGSRLLWWFTIMAPAEVMLQIVSVWHILEAKTSWSLRESLSRHSFSPADGDQSPPNSQINVSAPTCTAPVLPSNPSIPSVPATLDSSGAGTLQDFMPSQGASIEATLTSHSSCLVSTDPVTESLSPGILTSPSIVHPDPNLVSSDDCTSAPFLDQSHASPSQRALLEPPVDGMA